MKLKLTHSIEKAAVKSGFSCATGYRINKDSRLPSEKTKVKRTRRRPGQLAGIFEEQVVPMLEKCPNLRAVAVYREVMRLNPQLAPGVRRTLERRIRDWRAQHGPQQEVIFRQRQEPGRMGISDFTDMNRIGVTIGGCKFDHKLYHFRLAWSGFTHVDVVQGGESFAALAQGVQDALWTLGGVPRECRTDSLSAAFRNISKDDGEDLTESYRQLCEHYGMQATRNNRGVAHENGAIEGPHGHLKRAVEDALALRGSKDFETLDEYRDFIAQITGNINLRHSKKIEAEREVLQTLPGRRTTDYKETNVRITRSSGFVLRKVFYTVPSRLIGHRLGVRLYADRVELYLGSRHQLTLPATRSSPFIVQALVCACGQLSSCDSFSEAQANGADELGLPRSAVSARGVSTLFRGGTGAHHATASLSAGGTAVVVGSRPQLRSPAGAADRTMPAARNASGCAQDAKAIYRAARYHAATACGIEHSGQLCVAAAARS